MIGNLNDPEKLTIWSYDVIVANDRYDFENVKIPSILIMVSGGSFLQYKNIVCELMSLWNYKIFRIHVLIL